MTRESLHALMKTLCSQKSINKQILKKKKETKRKEVRSACSDVSDSYLTPWTVAHHASLSTGLFRQEHRSGLPFPTPGELPDPPIQPMSLSFPALVGGFLTTAPPRKPNEI